MSSAYGLQALQNVVNIKSNNKSNELVITFLQIY